MAAPMLLLAHSRAIARRLPKPGAWMLTLKQFLAFPLLATALWLLWVLGSQKGTSSVISALFSLLLLTLGIWIHRAAKSMNLKAIAWAVMFAGAASGFVLVAQSEEPGATTAAASAWHPFDPVSIEEKRKTQPVFVDFAASWCITCQVNKRAVLDTAEIQALFGKSGTYLVRADWTRHDPAITKALASFGRNSVPLYVVYFPGQEARRLPELLTKSMIVELFTKKGDSP
jgi:thiol:disulfide interchange protein DsbD